MHYRRLKTFFETYDEEVSLDDFQSIYVKKVHFKNPFDEFYDVAALYHFIQQLYQKVDDPKLVITEYVSDRKIIYLKWTFHFCFHEKQENHSIEGVSRIVCDTEGKILEHTDYWDAAKNIYETLPLLGSLIRWVKKKIRS